MALSPAVVEVVELKRASCPHCSTQRFYVMVAGKPFPIDGPSGVERQLASRVDGYQATSGTRNSLTVAGAGWVVGALVSQHLSILNAKSDIVQTRLVMSNTEDTVVVEPRFKRMFIDKSEQFWDSDNLPEFTIGEHQLANDSKIASKLRNSYVFACSKCSKRYTVEKP